ncbi:hypothetical protein Tco_1168688, partial [Tanacetum coccineum]
KRLATGSRSSYYIRDVASVALGLVLVCLSVWLDPEPIVIIRPKPRGLSMDSFGCLEGSNDKIDKLLDDGNDAEPEHPTKRDDDVLAENIAKDVSEKLKEDYRAATSNIGGKSLAAIHSLIPAGSSVLSEVTKPRIVASVTPTPDCGDDGPTDFISPVADAPIMTVAVTTSIVSDVFVVLVSKSRVKSGNLENFGDSVFADGANTNVANSSKLNEPATSSDSYYASQDLNSKTLYRIYVPKWKVTNDSIIDDPYICHDLIDRLAPLALFSQLRAMDYDQFYT